MPVEPGHIKTVLIMVAIALAIAVGIWLPSHIQRGWLHQRIAQAEYELGIGPNSTGNLRDLYRQVIALRREVNGAQRTIPKTAQLAQLQRSLTEALMAHGLTEQNKATLQIQRYADYSVIPVSLDFTGSFGGTYKVLQQIEAMSRLIRIDQLDIDVSGGDDQEPLDIRLELSTFLSDKSKADKP